MGCLNYYGFEYSKFDVMFLAELMEIGIATVVLMARSDVEMIACDRAYIGVQPV